MDWERFPLLRRFRDCLVGIAPSYHVVFQFVHADFFVGQLYLGAFFGASCDGQRLACFGDSGLDALSGVSGKLQRLALDDDYD